jgi:hypothetical protein
MIGRVKQSRNSRGRTCRPALRHAGHLRQAPPPRRPRRQGRPDQRLGHLRPLPDGLPQLDRLYRARKDRGFILFGVSTEEPDVQRQFVEQQISVSYPLLTIQGDVPDMYRSIERYPANFLIDRTPPAARPEQRRAPRELEAAVDALLAGDPGGCNEPVRDH